MMPYKYSLSPSWSASGGPSMAGDQWVARLKRAMTGMGKG